MAIVVPHAPGPAASRCRVRGLLRRLLDFLRNSGLWILSGLVDRGLRLRGNSALVDRLHGDRGRGTGDIAHGRGKEPKRSRERRRGQPEEQQERRCSSHESVERSIRLGERRRGARGHPAAHEEGDEETQTAPDSRRRYPRFWGLSSPPRALMPRAIPRTVRNRRTANAVTTPAIIGPQRMRSRMGTSATSTSTAGTPITPVAAVDGGNPVESIRPVADDSAARFPRGSVFIQLPPPCQRRWPRRTC